MNPFHRPIEVIIELYNSKLLLIPTIYEKQNQFCKKLINNIIQVKRKR